MTAALGITRTMQEGAGATCYRGDAGSGGARVLASGAVGRRAAGRQGAAALLVPREQEEGHGWFGDIGPAMQRRL